MGAAAEDGCGVGVGRAGSLLLLTLSLQLQPHLALLLVLVVVVMACFESELLRLPRNVGPAEDEAEDVVGVVVAVRPPIEQLLFS